MGFQVYPPAATGDVVGPASSTDNAIARFDGATGKLLQNSPVTIADTTGVIAGTEGIVLSYADVADGFTTTLYRNATTMTASNGMYLPSFTGYEGSMYSGYLGTPILSKSAAYTIGRYDGGITIVHPVGDTNDRTWTLCDDPFPPISSTVTFLNMSPNAVTIVPMGDFHLMYVDVGAINSAIIPQYNIVTALHYLEGFWFLSGSAGVTTT